MTPDYTGQSLGTAKELNLNASPLTLKSGTGSLNTNLYSSTHSSSSSVSSPKLDAQSSTKTNLPDITDILWRNSATGENVVWQMNGTTFKSSQDIQPISDTHWQIAGIGDFNHDGSNDLLLRNSATGQNVIGTLNGTTITSQKAILSVPDLNWNVKK